MRIADLNLSDYDYKSVNSNIRKYTNSIEYFENIISVKPDEKNQKYKRNYYFTDGGLNYAYIYDPITQMIGINYITMMMYFIVIKHQIKHISTVT